ncbi:hypothetical protein V5799_009661 [Amblyomma americanum]|uniref:ELYS-like domain-containing protein n=1 Tax=Amblyomma americanum TaxID=6943 RepID=A0AAQ4FB14_AMBAM
MLTRLEELRILYRLLGEARDMLMAKPWLVAVWQDVAGPPFGHLSALCFLLQSRVLPDHRVSEGCLAYPYTAFQTWYLQDKSDQGRKLLVDVVLVEADLRDAADLRSPLREGYPPPSIYLIPSLEPWTPHVVTYYLLLHISATIFHDYRPVKEKLKCFPSPFHLSTDVQSLVEDIWHLDHGNHEERVECLQQAQQQASAALRLLLDVLWAPDVRPLLPCQPPLALRCPDHLQVAFAPEQMTLQLDVLLANCRVIDAVELVHWHGHLSSQEQLLGCVMALTRKLNVWAARDQLELILQVPLSAADKEQLVNFCKLVDPTCRYHVGLYFLQSGHSHAALPLTGCLQKLFREANTQRSHLPEVRRKPTPEQPGPNLQHPSSLEPAPSTQTRSTNRDAVGNKAPGPGSGQTSSLERKALLAEFPIQVAARRLHSPTAAISAVAGPAQPEAKESLSQPAPAAAVPSLADSAETSDEEDLDGTPLMDSYEDTVPESRNRPRCPLHGADLSRGSVVTTPEYEKAVPRLAAAGALVGTTPFSTSHVGTPNVRTSDVLHTSVPKTSVLQYSALNTLALHIVRRLSNDVLCPVEEGDLSP